MSYVVVTFGDMREDILCEEYAEACAWARSIRNKGRKACIVGADAHVAYWDVWKEGMKPYTTCARSSEEALLFVRDLFNDDSIDTVQRHDGWKVKVTRPDGDTDVIDAANVTEARKYVQRYMARGWKAEVL